MQTPVYLARRQRGAFSILGAGTLLMSLMFLVLALDTGRLYMEQRKLQKMADTAALESVLRLEDGQCYSDPAAAANYANANKALYSNSSAITLDVSCAAVDTSSGIYQATPNPQGHAVSVVAKQTVPASLILQLQSFFSDAPSSVDLQATATAERELPSASFTVGSQLMRLDDNKLLGQLLRGVGLSADMLTLLDKDGLADASITPSGLLKALGINVGINELKALSPQGLVDLVDTQIGLLGIDRLVDLSAKLITDSALKPSLELLRLDILKSDLKNLQIHLFGNSEQPGLLSLITQNNDPLGSALDTRINLANLLNTAILLGVNQLDRALVIPDLNLLGLANVQLGIVEPPSIGIGPVGTEAYNAQIRLYIGVDTDELLGGLLSPLTRLLGIRVNLPIWIDVTAGKGRLEAISCNLETPRVDIAVESRIANVCVGKLPNELKWSGSASCERSLEEDELIKLLHIPVLSGKTHIPALEYNDTLLDMAAGDTLSTRPNKLLLGNTVEAAVDGLLDLLSGLFRRPNNAGGDLNYSDEAQRQQIKLLANSYLQASAGPGGFYNVDNAIELILQGGSERGEDGKQLIPPLVSSDWVIPGSLPKTCLLTTCPQSTWDDGTFSQAFKAYSLPHGLLDTLGISTLGNGYRSCGGLISALVDWNGCVAHNLNRLLNDPGSQVTLSGTSEGNSIADSSTDEVKCSGALCALLKPVVGLLKPILNGVGGLLDTTLNTVLGVELGRTDVTVDAINCGAPRLIR